MTGACPVCREQNCCGSCTKSACSGSRFAGCPHRNGDISKCPPHVRDKITELKRRKERQTQQRPCNLFNTAEGCRFGDKCKHLHKKRTATPASSTVNSFAEGSLDTFSRHQQFLEFERQSAQAQAAGAVTFEGGRDKQHFDRWWGNPLAQLPVCCSCSAGSHTPWSFSPRHSRDSDACDAAMRPAGESDA